MKYHAGSCDLCGGHGPLGLVKQDELGQLLCPRCKVAHEVAAEQLGIWIAEGRSTVDYRGHVVDLLAPFAAQRLARAFIASDRVTA